MTKLLALPLLLAATAARAEIFTIGIANQQSVSETGAIWLPILEYVQKKTGLELQMRMKPTAEETDVATNDGEYDFIYNNHNFSPKYSAANYKPLAQWGGSLVGVIVVPSTSRIKTLQDIDGQRIVFPNKSAPVTFNLACEALRTAGAKFKAEFAINPSQQGAAAILKSGAVDMASLNKGFYKRFVEKEGADKFRVIWESSPWPNLAVSVHPRVSQKAAEAVRAALVAMKDDPDGKAVIAQLEAKSFKGFEAVKDADYDLLRKLYKSTICSDL